MDNDEGIASQITDTEDDLTYVLNQLIDSHEKGTFV